MVITCGLSLCRSFLQLLYSIVCRSSTYKLRALLACSSIFSRLAHVVIALALMTALDPPIEQTFTIFVVSYEVNTVPL